MDLESSARLGGREQVPSAYAVRVTRELHALAQAKVTRERARADAAERRAGTAEAAAVSATKRADRLDERLVAIHHSTTWRVGRAALMVPRAVRAATRRAADLRTARVHQTKSS